MKLGLLADIHEDVERLQVALRRFDKEDVDQVVVLGDVAEWNQRLDETCQLLLDARAIGAWGNHDFGLCHMAANAQKHAEPVRQFMPTLKPRLELNGCLFSHAEPYLDATDVAELWHYNGPPETVKEARRSFAATSSRLLFVGHFHRWVAASVNAILAWQGTEPLHFEPGMRYLVSIGAVFHGASAILDLSDSVLYPFNDP
jgi:predicted phosphodiesterase